MRVKYTWLMRALFVAWIVTTIASFTMGMSWVWPTAFFIGFFVVAWHFGRWLYKNEGKRL
jgi:hypothetical protein